MKNKKTILNMVTISKNLRIALLLAIFVMVASVLYAQTDPGTPNGSDTPASDTAVPLDGGVSVLIAMAVGYRARKEILKRKAAKEQVTPEGKD
jgi:hypothetical protein